MTAPKALPISAATVQGVSALADRSLGAPGGGLVAQRPDQIQKRTGMTALTVMQQALRFSWALARGLEPSMGLLADVVRQGDAASPQRRADQSLFVVMRSAQQKAGHFQMLKQ